MGFIPARTLGVDSPGTGFTGPTIRTALFLGFGLPLIIGCPLATFTRRIADVEGRSAAINARYMQAQELLSTVRAQVLLGSSLCPRCVARSEATSVYRTNLKDTYASVDRALQQYVPVLDSAAERERVARLRHEIDEFRETMLRVLATDSTGRPPKRDSS